MECEMCHAIIVLSEAEYNVWRSAWMRIRCDEYDRIISDKAEIMRLRERIAELELKLLVKTME